MALKRYPSVDEQLRAAVNILSGRYRPPRPGDGQATSWEADPRSAGNGNGPISDAEWEILKHKVEGRDSRYE